MENIPFVLETLSRLAIVTVLIRILYSEEHASIELNEHAPERAKSIAKVLDALHGPFLLLALYLAGSFEKAWYAPMSAALLLSAMAGRRLGMATGLIKDCNCFGSLARHGTGIYRVLDWTLTISSALVLIIFFTAQQALANPPPFMGIALFGTALALSWLAGRSGSVMTKRQDPLHLAGGATPTTAAPMTFGADQTIGYDSTGREVKLQELQSSASILLFVGLSASCVTCSEAKPLLFRLAATFGEVQTIFITKDAAVPGDAADGSLVLYRAGDFIDALKATQFPFCAIINPFGLQQTGEVAYGVPDIWTMYYRLSAILQKRRKQAA